MASMSRRGCQWAISILACLIVQIAAAGPASFGDDANGLVFSFSVPQNTSDTDIYFNISAPATDSWVGVGMGDGMNDALIFVVYTDSQGGVTVSPRTAPGHEEPQLVRNVTLTKLEGTGQPGGVMRANMRCSGCRSWATGRLDVRSTEASFIFARGPPGELRSDALDAHIQQHQSFGIFALDLTQASDASEDQARPRPVAKPTSSDVDVLATHGRTLVAHGVLMVLVFFGLLPAGVAVLRVAHRPMGHAVVQAVSFLLAMIGFGLGVKLSKLRGETRHYATGHQVIGLLVVIGLMGQFVLGILHHMIYKQTNRTTPLAVPHVWLGRSIILGGIINGFLGYPLSSRPKNDFILLALVLLLLATVGILGIISLRAARQSRTQSQPLHKTSPASGAYPTATIHEHEMKYQITTPTTTTPRDGSSGKKGLGLTGLKVKVQNIGRPQLISHTAGPDGLARAVEKQQYEQQRHQQHQQQRQWSQRDDMSSPLRTPATANEPEYRGSRKGATVGLSRFQSPTPDTQPFGNSRGHGRGHGLEAGDRNDDVDSDGDEGGGGGYGGYGGYGYDGDRRGLRSAGDDEMGWRGVERNPSRGHESGHGHGHGGAGAGGHRPSRSGDLTLDTSARGLGLGREMRPQEMV